MLLCTGSALTSRLALKHKSVYGVAMGYTPVPEPGGGWQGCGIVDLMHLALGMNKSVLLLWPLYNDNRHKPAWQNVADSIRHFRDVGAPIGDDRVVVVLAMYGKGGRGVPWWNKTENSVEHAFTWLFEPFIYKNHLFAKTGSGQT